MDLHAYAYMDVYVDSLQTVLSNKRPMLPQDFESINGSMEADIRDLEAYTSSHFLHLAKT